MKNSMKMIKKLWTIVLILVLSANNFGAVVSDNDGSAFVTKEEFEALKDNFANQVTNYNDSIDKKIDGSIASYLAGIRLEKEEIIYNIISKEYDYIEMFNDNNLPPINHGLINGTFSCLQVMLGGTPTGDVGNGTIQTTYTSKSKVFYDRLWGKRKGNKFYDLCIYKGNIYGSVISIGTWTNRTMTRWLNPAAAIQTCLTPQSSGNLSTTVYNNANTESFTNTVFGSIIDRVDWESVYTERTANSPVQQYKLIYNSATNDYTIKQTWQHWLENTTMGVNASVFKNITAHTPTVQTTGLDMNNAWSPEVFTQSKEIKWEKENENTKTSLVGISPYPFTKNAVVWPLDSGDAKVIQLMKKQNVKSSFNFNMSNVRRVMTRNGYGDEWWYYDESYDDSDRYPNTVNWNLRNDRYYHGVPADWTAKVFIFGAGFNKNQLIYYDDDILNVSATGEFKNLLADNDISKGIPMWIIEKDGKLKVKLEFLDHTKSYNCWFTKGPMTFDSGAATDKPNNTYKYNKTKNSNNSVTLTYQDEVEFDVEKGDIVYVSWTEQGQEGGGAIKNPVTAIFVAE